MKVKRRYYDIIMYITSIVFTLIAWGAGLLLDANIHFGDPQGFLGLRSNIPDVLYNLFSAFIAIKKADQKEG